MGLGLRKRARPRFCEQRKSGGGGRSGGDSGGGGGDDALAGGAHGKGGGGELRVEWLRSLESPQLLQLLLQPSVLFREGLAASLQVLVFDLRLLQLRPVKPSRQHYYSGEETAGILTIKRKRGCSTLPFCSETKLPPAGDGG